MNLLAFDPGVSCGLAWNVELDLHHEVYHLGKEVAWNYRLADLMRRMREIIGPARINLVVVERIQVPKSPRPHLIKLHRYVGVVMAVAGERQVAVIECGQNEWKKALGSGNMTPDQYRRAAKVVLKLKELPAADEAAALGMWWWGRRHAKEEIND